MRKYSILHYILFFVCGLFSFLETTAQGSGKKDTLKFRSTAPPPAALSGGGGGGGGYAIVGELSPYAGYTYDYELQDGSGNTSFDADHWTVTCGTVINGAVNGATIQWNSSGCSSGVLRAFDASNGLLAVSTIPIYTPPVLSGGTITNPSQTINYNTGPAIIDVSFATGGACGGAYTFTWELSTDGSNYTTIPSATGPSYQPGALTSTTYFRRKTTCGGGTAYTTNVATVTVYPQLQAGSVSPSSQNINYNSSPGTLSVSGISGGNGSYSYQWYSSATTSGFSAISGASSSTYSPGNLTSSLYYQLEVTSNGVTAYSNYGLVNVYPQLVAGTASSSQNINYNTAPSALSATAASGGSSSYSYNWQSSSDNVNFSNIGGATSLSYGPGNLTATTYYRLAATSNGVTVYTNVLTIYVYPALQVGSISPSSQSINYNTAAGTLSSSGVSGGNGSYAYQWYSSATTSGFTPVAGAQSSSYAPETLTATRYYQLAVTSNGVTLFTSYVPVNVHPQLQAGSVNPSSQTINYNTAPGTLSVSGVSGGNGSYSYQWYSSLSTSGFSIISGATSASYSPGALNGTRYYQVAVTSNGVTVTGNYGVVNVYPPLVAGDASSSQSINYNTSPQAITATKGSGGNGSYTYNWQVSTDNVSFSNISGATDTTYSPGNLTATRYYRLSVMSNGATVYTNAVQIRVFPVLQSGTVTPATQTIAYNTIPSSLHVSDPAGGSGFYSYQWQSSADNTNFVNEGGQVRRSILRGNFRQQGIIVSSSAVTGLQ